MGKVYVLTNDSMPGIIKIGITDGIVEERIKQLDNTSVPLPFRFHFAIETDKHNEIEKFIHDAFAENRIRNNREFFKLDPERAVSALKISGAPEVKIGNEMIDSDGKIVEDRKIKTDKIYTKRFSFSFVDIPIGAELVFTRDENIKCKVVTETSVEYEGETYSLSKLADKFLKALGYTWKTVRGPDFFKYNGDTLTELKDKKIEEQENEGE